MQETLQANCPLCGSSAMQTHNVNTRSLSLPLSTGRQLGAGGSSEMFWPGHGTHHFCEAHDEACQYCGPSPPHCRGLGKYNLPCVPETEENWTESDRKSLPYGLNGFQGNTYQSNKLLLKEGRNIKKNKQIDEETT